MLGLPGLALVLAFTLCATSAFGAESKKLGEMEDGTVVSLAAVEATGAIRTVRTLTVFPAPREVLGQTGVVAELDVQLLDCAKRTQETTRLEFFGNAEASGTPLRVIALPVSVRTRVTVDAGTNSLVALIYRAVCSTAYAVPPPGMTNAPVASASPPPAPPLTGPRAAEAPLEGMAPPPTRPRAAEAPLEGMAPAPSPVVPSSSFPSVTQIPAGAVARVRPHANSVFTLRTVGLLSQYVYFDEERAQVLASAVSLMDAAKVRFVRPDNTGNPVVGLAHTKIVKREAAYQAGMAAKEDFLRSEQLVRIALPAVPSRPPAAFRAELYRHVPSGEYVLVFRGTQEMMDWVTNLWIGVDLLSVEAPHYRAARELTAKLVAQGIRPMVVGHSLGGGMAQYVGVFNRLNVVAFNSSPLPQRYLDKAAHQEPFQIRLFSAVEFTAGDPNARGHSDPVSLHAANLGSDLNEWARAKVNVEPVKAHFHAGPVVCVKSVPTPFLSKEEDEAWASTLNRMLYPSAVGPLLAGKPVQAAAEAAVQHYVADSTKKLFDDPVWIPAQAPKDKRVLALTHEVLGDAAVDIYQMARGAAAMGSILYNAALGSSMAAVKGMAIPVGAAAGKLAVKRLLMPHSMERFNRGMLADVGADVFIASTVYGECRQPKGM